MMVMCANHLPRSWSWKSVPSRIYPSWKTRIFDRTCSQHQRLFSWSHVRSKLFTHWSWCSHWLQLRKTLQLNNTCDIICGGETRDQLYLSSRGRNQFLPSREMLLESNMFLFATRKFKIMDWIWNREFTKVWIRWRRMERWSRNSALGPVCDVQWIQKNHTEVQSINQSINLGGLRGFGGQQWPLVHIQREQNKPDYFGRQESSWTSQISWICWLTNDTDQCSLRSGGSWWGSFGQNISIHRISLIFKFVISYHIIHISYQMFDDCPNWFILIML